MQSTALLFVSLAAVSASLLAPRAEITPAPVAKPRDIIGSFGSDIDPDAGSSIAGAASSAADAISVAGGDIAAGLSSDIDSIMSEAGPLSSSLAAELSSISTGTVASSLQSALGSLEASLSSATAAIATAAPHATTAAGFSTTSSNAGGAPAQTALVGIGALMGGVALLANM